MHVDHRNVSHFGVYDDQGFDFLRIEVDSARNYYEIFLLEAINEAAASRLAGDCIKTVVIA